ncbi:MAG TPA: ATP-binding protein, partial [Ginsengibacter sp.]|nr:ATP-binding protein [Ginsengibacter sp.]
FKRTVLEVMRQPMEERRVTISRAKVALDFPASFMLIASMNPCPCGYYNHPEKECTCAPGAVQKYLNKISGPLLDRIDLHVEVTPVPFSELSSSRSSEKSIDIRSRVIAAREIQAERFKDHPGVYSNAQMGSKLLKEVCIINTAGANLLKTAMEKLNLSARAYDRILKVSRTIADLAHSSEIKPEHLAEAIHYRSLDRENWAG